MSDLPKLSDPTCGDCIAYTEEHGGDGPTRGLCRFRPELGLLPQDYPYCDSFQVRQARAGKVREPPPKPRRRAPAPRPAAPPAEPPRATLKTPAQGHTSGELTMDRDGLKQVLRELLEEESMYGYPSLGARWEGGTAVLKPGDRDTQPKEVPLDALFHKIVMIRDRLRVLESKINGNGKLSDRDKVELQGYITKCYGSLTTFNVLFRDKRDQFSSK